MWVLYHVLQYKRYSTEPNWLDVTKTDYKQLELIHRRKTDKKVHKRLKRTSVFKSYPFRKGTVTILVVHCSFLRSLVNIKLGNDLYPCGSESGKKVSVSLNLATRNVFSVS